jgi:hypothetical protein
MALNTLKKKIQVGVKYRGSKGALKPIKSKMMDDNFECPIKEQPIITQKACDSDIWIYVSVLALAMALTALYLSL